MHCKIAEYYLQQLSQEENSTGKDYALPDLVTVAEEANAERKKRVRQQMSKCLRMFHTTSMKDLERESRYTKQNTFNKVALQNNVWFYSNSFIVLLSFLQYKWFRQ